MNVKTYRLLSRAFSLVLTVPGVILLLGGLRLIFLGGSWWYAFSGTALLISAVLVWCRSRWAARTYGVLLAGTVVWSVWEVGFNAWALVPRLDMFAVLGLWFLIPPPRQAHAGAPRPAWARVDPTMWVAVALMVAVIAAAYVRFDRRVVVGSDVASASLVSPLETPVQGDWRYYGNDSEGNRYSGLSQITPANVRRLRLAWSFRTGDLPRPGQQYDFETTPLEVGNLLYACTPSGQVYALNAVTGSLRWHFDAKGSMRGITTFTCRGVSYYSGASSGPCGKRIYVVTPNDELWSLDALTGAVCKDFGQHGAVNLLTDLGAVRRGTYSVTSPPLVTHGKVIVGSSIQDNVSIDMPSGVVRAYDAVTGRLVWAWDIGRPGDHGPPPAGETYTRSTPNAWAPLVADDARGLVYIPTGNPAGDFWDKQRRPYEENFGSSVVAVNVDTGETVWRFQVTHQDLWDNDVPDQPVLVDLPTKEGVQPAIVIGTKQGDIFVLNRVTGKPIVPVSAVPVPTRNNMGEHLSPAQPESALAVNPGPARLTGADMWGITPVDQMWCRIKFREARYEGPYTPLGTGAPSLIYPGMFGGIEWGGVAVDPVRKILIANPVAMPFLVRMARLPPVPEEGKGGDTRAREGIPRGLIPVVGTGYAASFFAFLSPLRIPCMQPPWGKLYAIDLDTGKVLWERLVGTIHDSGPFGIATHVPLLIGTPQVGGAIITGGGLIFMGATLDRYLRAYDLATGHELWQARLPAGGQATPMTYEVDGRQFVAIAAGGHSLLGTKVGDYLLAYALPTPREAQAITQHVPAAQ